MCSITIKKYQVFLYSLGPCYIISPKPQNQIYRIKSTNIAIVPMSAKTEKPSIWINELKKISIPEIEKVTKTSFQK